MKNSELRNTPNKTKCRALTSHKSEHCFDYGQEITLQYKENFTKDTPSEQIQFVFVGQKNGRPLTQWLHAGEFEILKSV